MGVRNQRFAVYSDGNVGGKFESWDNSRDPGKIKIDTATAAYTKSFTFNSLSSANGIILGFKYNNGTGTTRSAGTIQISISDTGFIYLPLFKSDQTIQITNGTLVIPAAAADTWAIYGSATAQLGLSLSLAAVHSLRIDISINSSTTPTTDETLQITGNVSAIEEV